MFDPNCKVASHVITLKFFKSRVTTSNDLKTDEGLIVSRNVLIPTIGRKRTKQASSPPTLAKLRTALLKRERKGNLRVVHARCSKVIRGVQRFKVLRSLWWKRETS